MSGAIAGLATLPSSDDRASPRFALPLRGGAAELEESALLKVIESEYTSKYLENLGASPSQAAQDLVRKALPLTADCLQTKLKASGHRHNEVIITPPNLQCDALPIHEADPQEVVRLGFVGALAPAARRLEDLQPGDANNQVMSRSFTEVAAAFLDNTNRKTSAHSSPLRRNAQRGEHTWASSRSGMPSVEPRAGRVGIYCHLNQMQRELARPFKVSPATVKRNQLHFGQSVSEWYNALPRAAKGGRGQLKEQDIQSTSNELVSDEIIALAVHAVTHLYYELVVSSPAFPQDHLPTVVLMQQKPIGRQKSLASQKTMLSSQFSGMSSTSWSALPAVQQQQLQSTQEATAGLSAADLAAATALLFEGQQVRLFSIVQLWAKRNKRYHHAKWATSFVRPVVILSLRALVDKLFTDALPIWSSSTQGAARLKSMDAQLLEWFDPHGFNSSISMLQSLPPAAQAEQGSKRAAQHHQHRKQDFSGTTSFVGTFLTTPKTAQCRRLQHQVCRKTPLEDSGMCAALDQHQKGALFKSAEQLLLRKR